MNQRSIPAFARAHRWALGVTVLLLLTYTLVGFFVVPRLIRSQIEEYATGTVHGSASIGALSVNPWTLELAIGDFKLADADGTQLIAFRSLYVNASLASLWRRGAILEEVRLDAPNVQVIVNPDGTVNLARLQPPPDPDASGKTSEPVQVRIGALAVTDGRLGLEDHTRAKPFAAEVRPIRFALTDFRTDAGYENAYQFAGTTRAGEQLQWSGEFTVQPLGSRGQFRVQDLKLATIDAYLAESLPARLARGELDFAGTYRLELEPLQLEVVLPSVALSDFALSARAEDAATPITIREAQLEELAFSYA